MKNLQFSHKFILLASSLLILALGATSFSNYLLLKEKTENDLVASLHEISSATSANISDWLNSKAKIVLSMAISMSEDIHEESLRKFLQQAQRTGDFKNTFIGMAGSKIMLLDDPSITLPSDYDPTIRPWYRLATQPSKIAFTEPYSDGAISINH